MTSFASTASDFAKIRSLHVNSSTRQQAIAAEFPDSADFKIKFNFTPIHIAVLDEYDKDDLERPSLEDLLNFTDDCNNAPAGEDWSAWRRKYRKLSPLYCDIIEAFREESAKRKKPEKVIIHLKDQPDAQGWTPFLWAAYTGRANHLRTLVKHGADPFTISSQGRNALHIASESKCVETLKYVLGIPAWEDEKLDFDRPDYWSETPLHIAASGSADCVRLLLAKGAKRDSLQMENQTPLHYAAYTPPAEKLKIVELLSEDCGAHIKIADEDGCTPAFYYVDALDCLSLLADRGADLTDRDPSGKTLVHHACIKNQPESLRFLLGALPGRHATLRDRANATPMAHALQSNSAACAKVLLERDAYADADGADGRFLVHHAARIGDADFLEAVLGHETFQRSRKTVDGQSSAEVAMAAGMWSGRVKELLLEHDAKVLRTQDHSEDAVDDNADVL